MNTSRTTNGVPCPLLRDTEANPNIGIDKSHQEADASHWRQPSVSAMTSSFQPQASQQAELNTHPSTSTSRRETTVKDEVVAERRGSTPFRDLRALSLGHGGRKKRVTATMSFVRGLQEPTQEPASVDATPSTRSPSASRSSTPFTTNVMTLRPHTVLAAPHSLEQTLGSTASSSSADHRATNGADAPFTCWVDPTVRRIGQLCPLPRLISCLLLALAALVCLYLTPEWTAGLSSSHSYGQAIFTRFPMLLVEAWKKDIELGATRGSIPFESYDFALLSSGARVAEAFTSSTYRGSGLYAIVLVKQSLGLRVASPLPPSVALEMDSDRCWPMVGQTGCIGIELPQAIHLHAVTVSYASASVVSDLRAAPRSLAIWGVRDDRDIVPDPQDLQASPSTAGRSLRQLLQSQPYATAYLLGRFTYDIQTLQPMQRFNISRQVQAFTFKIFVLEVQDNWGFEESTCLCRVGLHGEL